MIIPTEIVLETTPVTDSGKLILRGLEKDDSVISSSCHTMDTYTGSSVSDFDMSIRTQGPLVIPAARPIIKREDSDVSSGKSVCFGEVKVRSYAQTLGDNPSVCYGPPISLDWDYEEHDSIDIDKFEADRVFARRTHRQLAISYYRRKAILSRGYGFSEEELVKAHKSASMSKIKRSITNTLLPMMHVEAVFESAGRKAKRIIKRG